MRVTLVFPAARPQRGAAFAAGAGVRWWGAAALLWALGFAIVNATAALPSNPQLWWQLRQGELTLTTGHAVFVGSWSWTAGDLGWIPNSWGWGALLAVADRAAGLAGVVAFVLIAQLAVLGLAWHVLGRLGLPLGAARVGTLILLSLSLAGWANGQSELADYLAVFGFAAVCLHPRVRALRAGPRRVALAAAAFALAALWENLHLGGLLSIAVFVAVAVICAGREVRTLAVVAGGAALGVFATPAGAAAIAKSFDTAAKSRAEHYAAWGALFAQPSGYNYGPALLVLAMGAAALALVVHRRDWAVAGILAFSALASCVVVRSGSDLAMLSMLAGAPALVRLRMPRLRPPAAWRPRLGLIAAGIAAGWVTVAVCAAAASVAPPTRLTGVDPADLAVIPHDARVFSTISGSDVIDALRPDLQVTMDSRNDLYPVAQFEFAKSLTGAGVAQAPDYFEDNAVAAVFLPGTPSHEAGTKLAKRLTDAGWHAHRGVHSLVLLAPRVRAAG